MSNKGKLGNLVQAETSIVEKPDPDDQDDKVVIRSSN
jgi:hypothetical protein